MTDEQLIETIARAMFKDDQVCRLDIAKAALDACRPIIEALRAENARLQHLLDIRDTYLAEKGLGVDFMDWVGRADNAMGKSDE